MTDCAFYSLTCESYSLVSTKLFAVNLLQAYFTDGHYPDRTLMDNIAAKLSFDLVPYAAYMDNRDNFDKAEKSALSWRSKVTTGRSTQNERAAVLSSFT